MRRLTVMLSLTVLSVTLAACAGEAPSDAFCTAYDDVTSALEGADLEAALEALDRVEAEAPDDVASDVDTVRESVNAVLAGDPSAAESEEFTEADDNLASYAEGC